MSTEEQDIRIETEENSAEGQPAEETISKATVAVDVDAYLDTMYRTRTDIYDTIAVEPKEYDDYLAAGEGSGEAPEDTKAVRTGSDSEGQDGAGNEDDGPEGAGQEGDGTEESGAEGTEQEGDGTEESGAEGAEQDGDGTEDAEQEGDEAADEEAEKPEKDPETEAIKKKIRERKRQKKIKARRRRTRFWTLLSVFLFSVGAIIFSFSSYFTVDSIEVRGNSHFTAEEIINIAHAVPGHNILYEPGTKEIVDYLEQNPYIKSASVSRKLPSTLVINVEERKQALAFKYDDDYLVMDDEGILLKKTRTEPKITMIKGLVASKIKLGETIGTKNQQTFNRTLKLIKAMNEGDLYFVRIDMSEYEDDNYVRAYVYDKLVVKGDYDLLMDIITNGRLHKVLEKLFSDDVKRGTITLNEDGTASFEPGI